MSNREQFIAKMRADGCPDTWTFQDDGTGGFHNHATEWAWIAWNRAIESQATQIAALTAERDARTKALLAFRSAGIDLGWGAHPKWFHLIQQCDEALAARTQSHKEPT